MSHGHLTRTAPPQASVAWFVRDLVPHEVWSRLNIGVGEGRFLVPLQQRIFQLGGSRAWQQFTEQAADQLSNLLTISILDAMRAARRQAANLSEFTLTCHPLLTVYTEGRMLDDNIILDCSARFILKAMPVCEYVLADTEFELLHGSEHLIERIHGQYFVPTP